MKSLFFLLLSVAACPMFSQIPSYVPGNNLIAFWPFSGNANDHSSNLNHGIVNGASLTTDRFNSANSAYNFNGLNDHIIVLSNATLSGMNDLSISAWVNPNTFSGIQHIVSKWYQNAICNSNTKSDTYAAAFIGTDVHLATNNNLTAFPTPPSLNSNYLNSWTHIVYINDLTQGQMLYINGVLAAVNNAPGTICSSINDVYFGASQNGNTLERFFNGKIDDIGMWNRVLNDCEIKKLYLGTSLSASSSSSIICPGGIATITVGGAFTYSLNGSVVSSSIIVSPNSTTVYTVTGNYGIAGCNDTTTLSVNVNECTGLSEIDFPDAITLYPNPSKGYLTCDSKLFTETRYKGIIEDISGKKILQQNFVSEKCEMDIHEFESGIYFLRIINGDGRVIKTEKIILNN